MIDELEFNESVADPEFERLGCVFRDEQFRRAIEWGAVSLLKDDIRRVVIEAYRLAGEVNHWIAISRAQPCPSNEFNTAMTKVQDRTEHSTVLREALMSHIRENRPLATDHAPRFELLVGE